jgi:hypothetical protein
MTDVAAPPAKQRIDVMALKILVWQPTEEGQPWLAQLNHPKITVHATGATRVEAMRKIHEWRKKHGTPAKAKADA